LNREISFGAGLPRFKKSLRPMLWFTTTAIENVVFAAVNSSRSTAGLPEQQGEAVGIA